MGCQLTIQPVPEHTSAVTQPELTTVPRTQSWFTVADGGALGEAVAVGVGAAGWGDALTPAPLGDGVLDALAPHKVPVQSHVAQEPVLGPPRVPEEHTEVSKHHPQAVNVVHAEQVVAAGQLSEGAGGGEGEGAGHAATSHTHREHQNPLGPEPVPDAHELLPGHHPHPFAAAHVAHVANPVVHTSAEGEGEGESPAGRADPTRVVVVMASYIVTVDSDQDRK